MEIRQYFSVILLSVTLVGSGFQSAFATAAPMITGISPAIVVSGDTVSITGENLGKEIKLIVKSGQKDAQELFIIKPEKHMVSINRPRFVDSHFLPFQIRVPIHPILIHRNKRPQLFKAHLVRAHRRFRRVSQFLDHLVLVVAHIIQHVFNRVAT